MSTLNLSFDHRSIVIWRVVSSIHFSARFFFSFSNALLALVKFLSSFAFFFSFSMVSSAMFALDKRTLMFWHCFLGFLPPMAGFLPLFTSSFSFFSVRLLRGRKTRKKKFRIHWNGLLLFFVYILSSGYFITWIAPRCNSVFFYSLLFLSFHGHVLKCSWPTVYFVAHLIFLRSNFKACHEWIIIRLNVSV